jgi:putative spermidine/putrescine transport system ATP-binding protein
MAGLEIRGLTFRRPGFSLAVDLDLPAGCFGVILGASGCGKSTTLRLVAGLLAPEGGSIRLGGRELVGLPPERRNVGLMFQDLALFPHLTARKNIEYGPRLKGENRHKRGATALELAASLRIVPLLDRKPAALSGGEQQRVALARSLAASPELLLLDEPLSSLDTALRRELRIELRERICERGLSALHVTHDIEEALSLGDRIYLMDGGRIVQSGSPVEIWEKPRSAVAARLVGRGPLLVVRSVVAEAGGRVVRTDFGDFAVGGAVPEGACYLHFASEALGLPPGDRAGGGGLNLVSGTVFESAFAGKTERVLISSNGERLALEVPAGIHARRGERLVLFVAPGDCAVLPEHGLS